MFYTFAPYKKGLPLFGMAFLNLSLNHPSKLLKGPFFIQPSLVSLLLIVPPIEKIYLFFASLTKLYAS